MTRGKASIKVAKPPSSRSQKIKAGKDRRAAVRLARAKIIEQYNTVWDPCIERLEARLLVCKDVLKKATQVDIPSPFQCQPVMFIAERYVFTQPRAHVGVYSTGSSTRMWESHSKDWYRGRLGWVNHLRHLWTEDLERARDEAEQMRLKAEALRNVAEDMLRKQGEVWAEFDALPPPTEEGAV